METIEISYHTSKENIIRLISNDIKFECEDLTAEIATKYIPYVAYYEGISEAGKQLHYLLIMDRVVAKFEKQYPGISYYYHLFFDDKNNRMEFNEKRIQFFPNKIKIGDTTFTNLSTFEQDFTEYLQSLINEDNDEQESEPQDKYALFGVNRYNFI